MIIQSAAYVISSPDHNHCPEPDRPEYAFIGRSNVGKSSLINALTNHHNLAKTSGSPGKTQLINHFDVKSVQKAGAPVMPWYLVDLPGYGFAKVSQAQRKKWEKMIGDYLRLRPNLINVFMMLDSRHSPQKLDLDFADQLGEWQVPFCLVFTKSDKETQLMVSRNVKDFLERMRSRWEFLPRHFVTSAVKRTGREKILELIGEMNKAYNLDPGQTGFAG